MKVVPLWLVLTLPLIGQYIPPATGGGTIPVPVSGANGGLGLANAGYTLALVGVGTAPTFSFPSSATYTFPSGPASLPSLAGTNTYTGQHIISLAGALSTPPLLVSGTWITTGGTGTTTKPQVLLECNSGTTTSTAWQTTGTGLGVNACTGFGGYLLDLQVNGVEQLHSDASGNLTMRSIIFRANSATINTAGGQIGFSLPLNVGGAFGVTGAALNSTIQTNPILIVQDGNLGGTAQLQVAGTQATSTGDVNLCWKTTGIFTQGAVCGTSLARYKEKIAPLYHGLDYVMRMNPVTFDWKSDGHHDLGLIADEVAAIDPLLGAYGPDGLYNFRDRAVLATLIKAVQEIETQLKELHQ